ncbi:hypothetical protein ACFLZN_02830 [Nanoarchaeota archaeon]
MMQMMNMEHCLVDINSINPAKLTNKFRYLFDRRKEIQKQIIRMVPEMKQRAMRNSKELRTLIEGVNI